MRLWRAGGQLVCKVPRIGSALARNLLQGSSPGAYGPASATSAAPRRLVQSKDRGATIEVAGERVQLGIPQVRPASRPAGAPLCLAVARAARGSLSDQQEQRRAGQHRRQRAEDVCRHVADTWRYPTGHLLPAPPTHPPCCSCPQADGAAAAMKQLIALGRVGAPEEAAGAMLLLASPYASYVTGQSLEVTGGGWL